MAPMTQPMSRCQIMQSDSNVNELLWSLRYSLHLVRVPKCSLNHPKISTRSTSKTRDSDLRIRPLPASPILPVRPPGRRIEPFRRVSGQDSKRPSGPKPPPGWDRSHHSSRTNIDVERNTPRWRNETLSLSMRDAC